MGVQFQLSIDSEKFKAHTGPKINYSESSISANEFHIQNHGLLFEQDVKKQTIECFTAHNNKAFFKTKDSDFPFDIFAASFYLITRYEEYLPHEKDIYGRYDHKKSLAFKEGFLNLPLINIWVEDFIIAFQQKYPSFNHALGGTKFKIIPTYDVDITWSYKHKGLLRNIGGFVKSPSAERIKVLAGLKKDPFDCYEWLHQLHQQYILQPVYFFLVAEKNGQYDKNILPYKDTMWKLIRQHAKKYKVGLHPSWQSGDNKSLLKKEKQQLEAMSTIGQATPSGQTIVTKSRQHYIRFNLPEGYQRLISTGITDDYSMGYGTINGFRASVASSFYWYDLGKDENTILRIHPFCFMDANSFYEQKQSTQQTYDEMMHYLNICKNINGTLITIWHNNFLGTAREFEGWKEMYEQFIARAQQ